MRRIVTVREQAQRFLVAWELPPHSKAEIDPEHPDLRAVANVPDDGGRWNYPHLGGEDRGSYTSHDWGVHPADAPAVHTFTKYDRTNHVFYDPAKTGIEHDEFRDRATNRGNRIEDLEPENKDSGIAWRGMSHEEMEQAKQRGYFQSNGGYNFEGQEGTTLFDPKVSTAASYATHYAPMQHMPTFTRPAHVIGVPDQGYPRNSVGEIEVPGQIPLSAVTHHYRGDVSSITPGSFHGNQDQPNPEYGYNGFNDQPTRSMSPSATVTWSPGELHKGTQQIQASRCYIAEQKTATWSDRTGALTRLLRTAKEKTPMWYLTADADGRHPDHGWQERLFGCAHTACGRILPRYRIAAAFDDPAGWQNSSAVAPSPVATQGASAYHSLTGIPEPEPIDFSRPQRTQQSVATVGRAYDALPTYSPDAVPHFAAMQKEVNDQYHHMTHNLGINVQTVDHDPYPDVHHMMADVQNNKRLQVLGTHVTGGHPFFDDATNDKFRAVHDFFGHAGTGRGFDRHGEEAAYIKHRGMFTPAAQHALTAETRGQNSSLILNGGFGPQKIALMDPRMMTASTALDDYRWERDRQVREQERQTGGYATDTQDYLDHGGKPAITYKDWLKGRAIGDQEQAVREGPVSHDVHVPDASAWGTDDDTPEWARSAAADQWPGKTTRERRDIWMNLGKWSQDEIDENHLGHTPGDEYSRVAAKSYLEPGKCKYCKDPATKSILHSEGMAYVATCDKHFAKGKDAAERCTPDGSSDPGNIDKVYDLATKKVVEAALPLPHKDSWQPGETAHYEYHCLQSPESSDYHLWQRSHQPVQVLGLSPNAEDWSHESPTLAERADEGTPNVYRVKFGDGHEDDAWEDELLTHPGHYSPTHNPPEQQRTSRWYHEDDFRHPERLEGTRPVVVDHDGSVQELADWVRSAGLNGDLPELRYEHDQSPTTGRSRMKAYDGDNRVGWMDWEPRGQVENIDVNENYRRRGIGTEMWNRAKVIDPDIQHSHAQTADGRAWSQHTSVRKGRRIVTAREQAQLHLAEQARRISEDDMKTLMDQANEGGFTMRDRPGDGPGPGQGTMVSIPGSERMVSRPTPENQHQFLDDHWDAIHADPDLYAGGWKKNDQEFYNDVSRRHDDPWEAAHAAVGGSQDAVYDYDGRWDPKGDPTAVDTPQFLHDQIAKGGARWYT